MVQYPLHRYFVYDGKIKEKEEFIVSENAGGVYEVIRVAGAVPLFLDEHLDRFYRSARLAQHAIRFSRENITRFLTELIKENRVAEGNILLSCKLNLKAFFIRHKYPEASWFSTGVTCGILHAERENPNAKVFQTPVRQQADELMEKMGYYEVLLVDSRGRVTEGSRSNVFFVRGTQLLTPPGNEVLLGITRQKTLLLASRLNYPVLEQEIWLKDLQSYDAAFITGTSPKILPLSHIDEWAFDAKNKIVQQLRNEYDALINQYIASFPPLFNAD